MNVSEIKDTLNGYLNTEYDINMDDLLYTEMVVADAVSYLLGLIVVGIIIGITLIFAIDLVYITIPPVQEKIRQNNWDGTLEKTRFRLVSKEAVRAVEQSMNEGTSGVVGLYMKMKIKTLIIAVFVVIFVSYSSETIAGLIAGILTGIISAFSGI